MTFDGEDSDASLLSRPEDAVGEIWTVLDGRGQETGEDEPRTWTVRTIHKKQGSTEMELKWAGSCTVSSQDAHACLMLSRCQMSVTISRSVVLACFATTDLSCCSVMLPRTNWERSSFMISESLRMFLMVSATSVASATGREDRIGGSSSVCSRTVISGSRTGAQRCRRLAKTSRRCMRVESKGEDVGERGLDNVTNTGWLGGRRGESASWRSP